MFIRTVSLTRKKAVIFVLLLGLILSFAVLFAAHTAHTDEDIELFDAIDLTTDAQRRAYLQDLGWVVTGSAVETLDLILPQPLTQEYLHYNLIQLQQGLDLRPYSGKRVCRYTYSISNYPGIDGGVQVNLYVCEGRLIAGDTFYAGENGFSAPLSYPMKESA